MTETTCFDCGDVIEEDEDSATITTVAEEIVYHYGCLVNNIAREVKAQEANSD